MERVYSDTYSGGTTNRPGLKGLLEDIKRGTPKVIIADDISRLNRDLQGHLNVRKAIRDARCLLASLARAFEEDPDSIMFKNMQAVFSEHARAKNSQQVISRMKGRLLSGGWPFKVPYGYLRITKNGRSEVVADPVHFPILQEALLGFESGRFLSVAETRRLLIQQPAFIRRYPEGSRTIQRVTDMLSKQMYSGFHEYPAYEVPLLRGNYPAAITYEQHLQILERLAPRRKAPQTELSADFPLRDYLVCGDCGGAMTGCWSQNKLKKYPYYQCFNKKCASARKSISRDEIHGEFADLLDQLVPTEFGFEVFEAFLSAAQQRVSAGREAELAILEAEAKRLGIERINLSRKIIEEVDPDIEAELRKRHAQKQRDHALVMPNQNRCANYRAQVQTFRTLSKISQRSEKKLDRWILEGKEARGSDLFRCSTRIPAQKRLSNTENYSDFQSIERRRKRRI